MRALHAIGLTILLSAASVAPGFSGAAGEPLTSCFHTRDVAGWKATDDARVIYIRVRDHRVFRLGLAGRCSLLKAPDAYLVTTVRGSDLVCHPIDWDLKVAQEDGGVMGCNVHDIAELRPAEAAALPRKLKP